MDRLLLLAREGVHGLRLNLVAAGLAAAALAIAGALLASAQWASQPQPPPARHAFLAGPLGPGEALEQQFTAPVDHLTRVRLRLAVPESDVGSRPQVLARLRDGDDLVREVRFDRLDLGTAPTDVWWDFAPLVGVRGRTLTVQVAVGQASPARLLATGRTRDRSTARVAGDQRHTRRIARGPGSRVGSRAGTWGDRGGDRKRGARRSTPARGGGRGGGRCGRRGADSAASRPGAVDRRRVARAGGRPGAAGARGRDSDVRRRAGAGARPGVLEEGRHRAGRRCSRAVGSSACARRVSSTRLAQRRTRQARVGVGAGGGRLARRRPGGANARAGLGGLGCGADRVDPYGRGVGQVRDADLR